MLLQKPKFSLIISLLILINTACITIPYFTIPDNLQAIDEAKLEQGVEVYLANYCGACHTLDIAESVGTFGPEQNDIATLAEEHLSSTGYTGEATTVEDYIRESIVNPSIYLVPEYIASSHAMPAFTNLSDEDLEALVYMLSQQQLEH
ncbi:MAG: hypothetical protein Phog2KO_32020 [Phototrophicaceae bacterium]